MSSREREMAALLARLRVEFLVQLGAYLIELRQYASESAVERENTERKALIARIAHKLAGTGTSYGFPEVTRSARALEQALSEGSPRGAVEHALHGLEAACCDALETRQLADGASDTREPEAPLAPNTWEGPTVQPTMLIADDDAAVRELVAAIFARDARVITASDGAAALRVIREAEPDLVLLDHDMPDIKGTAILETMAAEDRFSRCAAIMLTAHDDSADIARAMAIGAVDYVVKPFRADTLTTRVRAVLSRIRTTVVIADDDAAVRSLLAMKLRLAGLRVIVTDSGTDALMKIRQHRPQLAILDRMMPGLDGLATLLAIRRDAELRQMPVVLLTAKRHERDIVEGLQCGANDYVAKPFSPDELMVRCLRLLRVAA
jgi:DNA-binding response OmpR family regulator/HPt (histidine-containing phosphotransfer) domain-containing protein